MSDAETQTITPGLATPGDDPDPPKVLGKKPTAANRYRLFEDGDGDYRIYEITKSDSGMPRGSLVPIGGVPGFLTTYIAKKFITNSGDKFSGKQLMIFKGLEICSVEVETVSKVGVNYKPKKAVTGPAAGGGEDGE